MVYIRPSLPGDTWLILTDLRRPEVEELNALGVSSEVCLRYGILHGAAQTLFIDEKPAGVFGVADYGSHRVPWAVFSTVIDQYPVSFLRAAKRWAESVRGPVPLLNYVDVRNERAVKWFAWMGFEVGEPVAYGLDGELFRKVRLQ